MAGPIVRAAVEVIEARADSAVAGDDRYLVHRLELGDFGDAVALQLRLERPADTPDQVDRLVGEERYGIVAADDREAARLVEIGGDLGEKLVVAQADAGADADLRLDAQDEPRQRPRGRAVVQRLRAGQVEERSEEHTSELPS